MAKGVDLDKDVAAELKALRKMKMDYERLQLEHALLKKQSSSLPLEKRSLRLHRVLPRRRLPGEDVVQALRGES